MQYTVKADSLLRAKERAANAGAEADAFLNELLDLSAGIDSSGTTHFRIFYCASVWLEQSPQFQTLSKAEGIEFTQMVSAIASLRSLQVGYDLRYQLIVPKGFQIIATTTPKSRVFGSSTLKTVVTP